MCSKSLVSTAPRSSVRLCTTEGTPHYTAHKLSQKSKMASSTLQRETREITQDHVTQLSAAFVISLKFQCLYTPIEKKLCF